MFSPLSRAPAYTRVSTEIERRIVARILNDGDLLPAEGELARQFDVHRSTVREAFRRLESEGLIARRRGSRRMVVTRPDRGAVARGLSRALMLNDVTFHDVWEALAVVEPELAALAAQRHADEALGRLEAPHAAFAASPAGDVGSVALVGEFFDALALASGNRVLALAAQPLIQLLEPSLAQVIDRVPQARGRIHDAQRHIVAAIRARDAAEARTWMTRHVGDFRRGFELAGIAPGQAVGAAREPDAAQAD